MKYNVSTRHRLSLVFTFIREDPARENQRNPSDVTSWAQLESHVL
uniref:Uncharacterized protein n=1 Tax=Pfiesteria piscicida TaxID=71001 RepID=E8Z6A3_PFIPI|nr:unknown [Pfiesteria piscicida]